MTFGVETTLLEWKQPFWSGKGILSGGEGGGLSGVGLGGPNTPSSTLPICTESEYIYDYSTEMY